MKKVPVHPSLFSLCITASFAGILFLFSACQKDMKGSSASLSSSDNDRSTAASLNAVASVVDTSGLVAWFSFDSGSLRDVSTYHNKIIFNNAVPTADRNGVANNAYYFAGDSTFMEVKNSPSLSPQSAITLFAIVRFDDFYEGICHGNRVIFKGFYDPGAYSLGCSDGYYTHSMGCSQPVDKAHETLEASLLYSGATDTAGYVQTGHWYHIVYTYAKGTSKLYVDGVLKETVRAAASMRSNSEDLYFGTTNKSNTQYPYWFHGALDQVGIFSQALSTAQVARLSNL